MRVAETNAYVAHKVQSIATAPASEHQGHLSLAELKFQVAYLIEQPY